METIIARGDLGSVLSKFDEDSRIDKVAHNAKVNLTPHSSDIVLTTTTNAEIWADEFMRLIVNRRPPMPISRGLMLGWFANAIMTGYDWGILEREQKSALIEEEMKTPGGPIHPTAHEPNCGCVQPMTERTPF